MQSICLCCYPIEKKLTINLGNCCVIAGTLYTGLSDGRIVKIVDDKIDEVVRTGIPSPCGELNIYEFHYLKSS